jgi:hypothetical protein
MSIPIINEMKSNHDNTDLPYPFIISSIQKILKATLAVSDIIFSIMIRVNLIIHTHM